MRYTFFIMIVIVLPDQSSNMQNLKQSWEVIHF